MATTPPLIRVSFKSDKEKIGLTNYSDLVIFDKNHSIIAIRLGGYPETVHVIAHIRDSICIIKNGLNKSPFYYNIIPG